MRPIAEIKKAFFELVENSEEMDDWTRIKNGYAWMVENGYSEDITNWLKDHEEFGNCIEIIANGYYGRRKKDSSLRRMHNEYMLDNDIHFNHVTERYESNKY